MNETEASIDYTKIINLWSQNYKLFLSIAIIVSSLTFLFTLFIEDIYQSSSKVSRSSAVSYFNFEDENTSSLGGVSDFLSGSDESVLSMDEIALEFLSSKEYIINFLKDNNYEPLLLAVKEYDLESDLIIFDKDIYDEEKGQFKTTAFPDLQSIEEALFGAFEENFYFEKKPGSIYIFKFNHVSPFFSKELLEVLIKDINSFIQLRELRKSKKRSTFLSERLSKNQITSIQLNLSSMLAKELQKQVYLETSESFVFESIDPPRTQLEPIYPMRIIISLFSFFVTLFLLFVYRLLKT